MDGHEVHTGGMDLDPEVFRQEAHRMVDWIADYLGGGVRRYPVLAQVEPGDVARRHPASPPEEAEPPAEEEAPAPEEPPPAETP